LFHPHSSKRFSLYQNVQRGLENYPALISMAVEDLRHRAYFSFPSSSEVNPERPYTSTFLIKFHAFYRNLICVTAEDDDSNRVDDLRIQAK
jgi:hypothetical protein